MRLEAWGGSETGLIRTRNDDAFTLLPSAIHPGHDLGQALFAVADGMGGHPGGDVAAQVAIESVVATTQAPAESPRDWLERMHDVARASIELRAQNDPRLAQMGTTLTVAVLSEGRCWVNHIGDTRLYWIRGTEIVCVTRDHTVAQEMVDAGRLAAAASEGHPMGNVLTRCLGVCPDQRADRPERPLALRTGDQLILASDGLIKTLGVRDLPPMLDGRAAEVSARALLATSLARGAPDNVTVIVVSVLEAPPEAAGDGVSFTDLEAEPDRA